MRFINPVGGDKATEALIVRTWAQLLHVLTCMDCSTHTDKFINDNWDVLLTALRKDNSLIIANIPRAALQYVQAVHFYPEKQGE
jgi:hypothetical protein